MAFKPYPAPEPSGCIHLPAVAATSHDNPFALLGIEPRYRVDRAAVERAYLARLAQAHPDAGGQREHDAAALNLARATLLNDEARAVALLELLGGPDASTLKALPEGFLMDIMARRQEIEEQIEAGGDEARDQWEQWARLQRTANRDRVAELFTSLPDAPEPESLGEIRVQLNAWRYIERLIEQLDPDDGPPERGSDDG